MTLAKLDVLTSMIAACLEITSVGLAFNSFILLLPDMFIVANSSNDPYHHAEQLPYAQVFSCVSGVILGNAALLDIWHPLVRGHGSGVSKYVSVPVSIMKVVSVIVVVAWAVSSIILSSFFTEAVFPNSSPNLCELSQDQCSAASAVAVEACTTVVLVIVSVVAHCCGSCRFCPGNRKKFTNVMIQSSKGPFKNFGWLGALVLGLAGMATQLLLAWLATANDLDVNASEAQDSWTDIPWVVRGISLGSAAMVLFATLCDIMAVALATDRVQKLATNRVETISTVLKICSLIASVICAICVTLDYTKWSAKVCYEIISILSNTYKILQVLFSCDIDITFSEFTKQHSL